MGERPGPEGLYEGNIIPMRRKERPRPVLELTEQEKQLKGYLDRVIELAREGHKLDDETPEGNEMRQAKAELDRYMKDMTSSFTEI